MRATLTSKVVGVAVELTEEEFKALDHWFSCQHGRVDPPHPGEYERGFQVMIGACKLFREGFHKDGD